MKSAFTYLVSIGLAFAFSETGLASAQTIDPNDLDRIAAEQAAAKIRNDKLEAEKTAIRRDLANLDKSLREAANKHAAIEAKSTAIENRLTALSEEEMDKLTKLSDNKNSMQGIIAALQRLKHNPPPTAILTTDNAADSARAGMIITSLTEQLDVKAKGLSDDIAALNTTRNDISAEQTKLAANEALLEKERKTMRGLVNQKTKRRETVSKTQKTEAARIKKLAQEASNLQDLIRSIERSTRTVTPRLKPKRDKNGNIPRRTTPRLQSGGGPSAPLSLPSGTKRFANAKTDIHRPVAGRVTTRYGGSEKGYTIKTRKGAQVTAPYTGRAEFAGDFKNYGRVVILNVGDGYFVLLTGLGETFVKSGDMITKGDPLGLMPNTSDATSNLYVEIRKNGQTIDPSPWIGSVFAAKS